MADIQVTGKIDVGYFLQQWERYKKVMSRTLPQAINDKLFMVARAALWNTHNADTKDIQKTLGRVSVSTTKTGATRYRHRLVKARDHEAPLMALIIQKRRGRGHGYSPGRDMREAVAKAISARMRSVNYIKSGWIPSIQYLAQFSSIKTKTVPSGVVEIGKAKGRAQEAKMGNIVKGFIENFAYGKTQWSSRHQDKAAAFHKFGDKGLQIGFDYEGKRTAQYVEGKIQKPADDFNRAMR